MQKREVFGFRKSKISKTLCGAVLGTVAAVSMAGQHVFADETTSKVDTTAVVGTQTGNPATNLPDAQGNASNEAEQSQNTAKADAYTVQYGDSFYAIATKFGMSPYDLAAKKWKNNLRYYPSWRYVTSKWPNGYYC